MKRNIMNEKIESAMKKFNQWTMKQQTRNKHKIKSITHEHVYLIFELVRLMLTYV